MSDRGLLIVHAVLGFAAVMAGTHHAAHAVLAAMSRPQIRALRRFGWIVPAAAVAQAVAGLLLYPAYRIRVRAAHPEANAVVQLFELKEHLAALSLALVVAAALAGRARNAPREARWTIAALSSVGAAFLWIAAIAGLYVTAEHPL